jgi:signal peptidase II
MKNTKAKGVSGYKNLFLIGGTLLLLDQVSKYLVRAYLHPGEIFPQGHPIVHYARIINWQNPGAILGILKNQTALLTIYAIVVSAAIIFFYPRLSKQSQALSLALSLMFAGSLGNMIDRLHQGFVTDFISIGNLPAFNIADICLLSSSIIIFVVWYRWDDKDKAPKVEVDSQEKKPQPTKEA